MKPVIGEINYKDMTPEDIDYYVRQAEKLRAAAIHDMFGTLGRALTGLFKPAAKTEKPTTVIINRSDMVGVQ